MANDPFYSPHYKGGFRQPKLGEPLWSISKDLVRWSAELRFHGESWGWEAQILRDGDLVIGRRFPLKEAAIKWAEDERDAIVYDRYDSWREGGQ